MGRPLKKIWFTAKTGSIAGDLTLAVGIAGTAEAVIKQTGTGVYDVASGRVKLSDPTATGYVATDPDPATGVVGTATLEHDGAGAYVRKINQYLLYHFDGSVHQWRDTDGNTIGLFDPLFTADPGTKVTATGTVVSGGEGSDANTVANVTIDDGGKGYASAPTVTFSAGTGSTATGTAVLSGDAVASVTMGLAGSYTDIEIAAATVTFSAP